LDSLKHILASAVGRKLTEKEFLESSQIFEDEMQYLYKQKPKIENLNAKKVQNKQ